MPNEEFSSGPVRNRGIIRWHRRNRVTAIESASWRGCIASGGSPSSMRFFRILSPRYKPSRMHSSSVKKRNKEGSGHGKHCLYSMRCDERYLRGAFIAKLPYLRCPDAALERAVFFVSRAEQPPPGARLDGAAGSRSLHRSEYPCGDRPCAFSVRIY